MVLFLIPYVYPGQTNNTYLNPCAFYSPLSCKERQSLISLVRGKAQHLNQFNQGEALDQTHGFHGQLNQVSLRLTSTSRILERGARSDDSNSVHILARHSMFCFIPNLLQESVLQRATL